MNTENGLRAVIEEFGQLLGALGGQLNAALHEADQQFVAVGSAFYGLATANHGIRSLAGETEAGFELRIHCESIDTALDAAIVGLQFHDRLSQRIGHIGEELHNLKLLLGDGLDRSFEEWLALLRDADQGHRADQARLAAAPAASSSSAELF